MIVAISWVRNEEDIIEWFVRHNAAFVDRMIVIDNGSGDRTLPILRLLQGEGLPLDILCDQAPFHRQDAALTELLPEALRMGADWILPLDADEFLCAAPGRDVRTLLAALSCDRITLLPWRTYAPHPSDDPREPNPLRRIRFRREREHPLFHKAIIPSSLASRTGARIAAGSHALLRSDGEPFHAVATSALFLAHFPVRSPAQIRRKVTEGWRRHCANPLRSPGTMYHWRDLSARLSAREHCTADDLADIAGRYAAPCEASSPALVCDPIPSLDTQCREPRPCFLVIWLGPFPWSMGFFLASCKRNPHFMWLLITDQARPADCPQNVQVVPVTAEELAARFRAVTGIPVTLPPAYRLCDLRPIFGEVFAEELRGYSHWGHCDLDVIFGDIGRFFTRKRLQRYDVLTADASWICGPCTLYRNASFLTTLWRCIPLFRDTLTAPMDPQRRTMEEADFARIIAEQPHLHVFSLHAQCGPFDTTVALWREGRLWRSDGTAALMTHLFRWKHLPIDPPDLHESPAWRISADGIRAAPPSSRPPCRRRERHGILTMVDPSTVADVLHLATSFHCRGEFRIVAFQRGLSGIQRLRCRLSGICLLPMPEGGATIPSLLRRSPFPMTLWLDPRCRVLRSLKDLWVLLQGRPHATFERVVATDGSMRVAVEEGPSLAVIGFVLPRDRRLLDAWERGIAAGGGGRQVLESALRTCGKEWVIAQNGVWCTRLPASLSAHTCAALRRMFPELRIAAVPEKSSIAPPKTPVPDAAQRPAAPRWGN